MKENDRKRSANIHESNWGKLNFSRHMQKCTGKKRVNFLKLKFFKAEIFSTVIIRRRSKDFFLTFL